MATPAALALATGDSAAGDCTVVVALALTVAELVVVTGAEVLVRADAADVVGAPELVPRLLLAVPDAAELAVTASAAVLLWGVLVPAVPPQAAIKGTAARVVTALSAWTTNARRLVKANRIAMAVLSGASNAIGIPQRIVRNMVAYPTIPICQYRVRHGDPEK